MKNHPNQLSLETRFVRVLMLMRGIDERELARRAGVGLGSVRNLLAEQPGGWPSVKAGIERVFDTPIWTKPSQFRRRRSSTV